MDSGGRIRWGVLGTANIARVQFLPGLRETGGGIAEAVAGREPARTEAYARENGVRRALSGYRALIEDPTVDAVYNPLPNSLHAEWTLAALAAGKAVLTEKPLCVSPAETRTVLGAARAPGRLLWEAFVFPFHAQYRRVEALVEAGGIGPLLEIQAFFHFRLRSRDNIRLRPDLAGGALNDVGCYPIHLGTLLFGGEPLDARATRRLDPSGVDAETAAMLDFGQGRRLYFSCGLERGYETFARIVGGEGEIRLASAYHPGAADSLELRRADRSVLIEHPTDHVRSFAPAIRHIHAVLRGEEAPRHLALQDALATAEALERTRRATAGQGPGARS